MMDAAPDFSSLLYWLWQYENEALVLSWAFAIHEVRRIRLPQMHSRLRPWLHGLLAAGYNETGKLHLHNSSLTIAIQLCLRRMVASPLQHLQPTIFNFIFLSYVIVFHGPIFIEGFKH